MIRINFFYNYAYNMAFSINPISAFYGRPYGPNSKLFNLFVFHSNKIKWMNFWATFEVDALNGKKREERGPLHRPTNDSKLDAKKLRPLLSASSFSPYTYFFFKMRESFIVHFMYPFISFLFTFLLQCVRILLFTL